MKSKRKVETAIVDSLKSAEAFMDWCESNGHRVSRILIAYETDGAKARYIDTIMVEKDPVLIRKIARDYGLGVGELYRILVEEGFLEFSESSGRYELGPMYKDEDGFLVREDMAFGGAKVLRFTRYTRRARLEIHTILTERGIEPVMDREEGRT